MLKVITRELVILDHGLVEVEGSVRFPDACLLLCCQLVPIAGYIMKAIVSLGDSCTLQKSRMGRNLRFKKSDFIKS